MPFHIITLPTGSDLLWQEPVTVDAFGNRLTTLTGVDFEFIVIADPSTTGPAVLTARLNAGLAVAGTNVRLAVSSLEYLVAGRTYHWTLYGRTAAGVKWVVSQGVVHRYASPAADFTGVAGQVVTDNDGTQLVDNDGTPVVDNP